MQKPNYGETIYVVGISRDHFQFWSEAAEGLAALASENGRYRVIAIDHRDYLDTLAPAWRGKYDAVIAVHDPFDVDAVASIIRRSPYGQPALITTNFDAYVGVAGELDRALANGSVYRGNVMGSNKVAFRRTMASLGYGDYQPPHAFARYATDITEATIPPGDPLVVKSDLSAGSRGTFVTSGLHQTRAGITEALRTINHVGLPTREVVVESFVEGVEYSLQVIVRNSIAEIITFADKITALGRAEGSSEFQSVQEFGHVLRPGAVLHNPNFQRAAQATTHTMGCTNGIMQIDVFERASDRQVIVIDPAVRPPGGNLSLVQRSMGLDIATPVLAAVLGRAEMSVGTPVGSGARCSLPNHGAAEYARNLQRKHPGLVRVIDSPFSVRMVPSSPITQAFIEHFSSLGTAIVTTPSDSMARRIVESIHEQAIAHSRSTQRSIAESTFAHATPPTPPK